MTESVAVGADSCDPTALASSLAPTATKHGGIQTALAFLGAPAGGYRFSTGDHIPRVASADCLKKLSVLGGCTACGILQGDSRELALSDFLMVIDAYTLAAEFVALAFVLQEHFCHEHSTVMQLKADFETSSGTDEEHKPRLIIHTDVQNAFKELRHVFEQVRRAVDKVPDEITCPTLIYNKKYLEERLAALVVVEAFLQKHVMRTCQKRLVALMTKCEEVPRWEHIFKDDTSYSKKLATKVLLKSPLRESLPNDGQLLFELRTSMMLVAHEWGLQLGEINEDLDAADAVFEDVRLVCAVTAGLVILEEHDATEGKELASQFLAARHPPKFPKSLNKALRKLCGQD